MEIIGLFILFLIFSLLRAAAESGKKKPAGRPQRPRRMTLPELGEFDLSELFGLPGMSPPMPRKLHRPPPGMNRGVLRNRKGGRVHHRLQNAPDIRNRRRRGKLLPPSRQRKPNSSANCCAGIPWSIR